MEPVTNTHAFDDFGTRTYGAYGHHEASSGGARTGFAGEVGEADLPWYLLGDRFYVPSLQRFASPDTNSPFGAGGLNRYAYCGGDPISRIDPSGEAWWEWVVAGLGLAAAVAATVVSAGALAAPIAAAAAGGLTATVSTTTMVTLTAAVALDVVAVVAEIGAIASMAAGDEKAMGIFGWVALGTGVASIGLAGLPKAGASAGKFAGGGRPGSTRTPHTTSRKSFGGKRYTRREYTLMGGDARIKHYSGEAAVMKKIPHRRVAPKADPRTQWHRHFNKKGGINYVADTRISSDTIDDLTKTLFHSNQRMPIVILSGAHGVPSGNNWKHGSRLFPDAGFFAEDVSKINKYAANAGRLPTQVSVIDLAKIDNAEFVRVINKKAHVIHGYCFSAADWETIFYFCVPEVNLYSVG